MGVLSRGKHPLQQLHLKKRGGRIFEGGLLFGRLRYVFNGGNLSCTWFTFLLHFINYLLKLGLCLFFLVL